MREERIEVREEWIEYVYLWGVKKVYKQFPLPLPSGDISGALKIIYRIDFGFNSELINF